MLGRGLSLAVPTLCGLACTLPPLRGEMEIGRDAYVVFVGEGSGGADLYAARPGGGVTIALTFSPVAESAPALSPDGASLAFIRTAENLPATAWLMNLLSGAEREVALPREANAIPRRVGWAPDGSALYVDTDRGIWRADIPPRNEAAAPVTGMELAIADSSLSILVGKPEFAAVEACEGAVPGLCVRSNGSESVVAAGAEFGARWGNDSIAYVREGIVEVRPAGPGRPRRVEFTPARTVTGGLTYFAGSR